MTERPALRVVGKTPPCPICAKPGMAPFAPFCSKRCQTIDLGRWLNESYRVPTDEPTDDPTER